MVSCLLDLGETLYACVWLHVSSPQTSSKRPTWAIPMAMIPPSLPLTPLTINTSYLLSGVALITVKLQCSLVPMEIAVGEIFAVGGHNNHEEVFFFFLRPHN